MTRVDFYLAEDPEESRVAVDGSFTDAPIRLESKYGQPNRLMLNGQAHPGPWEAHVHWPSGAVETCTDGDKDLEVTHVL